MLSNGSVIIKEKREWEEKVIDPGTETEEGTAEKEDH
jgi:hypothetical protein